MSDNEKNVAEVCEKDLRKRYEKMGKLKADVGAAPLAYTVVVYVLAVLAVFGLLFGLMNMRNTVGKISLIAAGVSAALLILLYFIASRKGPARYTEVFLKFAGRQLLFQIIDERHVIFTDGEITLEYDKKQIKDRHEGIMNPHLRFDAPLHATYKAIENKGIKTVYVGEVPSDNGEKPLVYRVACEGKFVSGFKVNGKSVNFDNINQKGVSLALPAPLIEAIQERGITLPPKDIAVSGK